MANSFTYHDQNFGTGDTVRLHLSVTEGDKTRIQVFEGIIIDIHGEGVNKAITVRKIATNAIGVERIVPLAAPTLTKIELKAAGKVRRAKLYYLRDRIGKQAVKVKVKETVDQGQGSTGRKTGKKTASK